MMRNGSVQFGASVTHESLLSYPIPSPNLNLDHFQGSLRTQGPHLPEPGSLEGIRRPTGIIATAARCSIFLLCGGIRTVGTVPRYVGSAEPHDPILPQPRSLPSKRAHVKPKRTCRPSQEQRSSPSIGPPTASPLAAFPLNLSLVLDPPG